MRDARSRGFTLGPRSLLLNPQVSRDFLEFGLGSDNRPSSHSGLRCIFVHCHDCRQFPSRESKGVGELLNRLCLWISQDFSYVVSLLVESASQADRRAGAETAPLLGICEAPLTAHSNATTTLVAACHLQPNQETSA